MEGGGWTSSRRGSSVAGDRLSTASKSVTQQEDLAASGPATALKAQNVKQEVTTQARAVLNFAVETKRRLRNILLTKTSRGDFGHSEIMHVSVDDPPLLRNGTLQAHQIVGLQWLIACRACGIGCILADDMGLGKTVQVAAMLAQLLQWHVDDHADGGMDDRVKLCFNSGQGRLVTGHKISPDQVHNPPPLASSSSAQALPDLHTVHDAVRASNQSQVLVEKMIAFQTSISMEGSATGQGVYSHILPTVSPDRELMRDDVLVNTLRRGSAGPHLVIAPSSTLANWLRELNKWCPFLKVCVYAGDKSVRDEVKDLLARHNVVITSYALMERGEGSKALAKVEWDTLILDEAHGAKNAESAKFGKIMSMSTRHRVLLTGTPVQNNLTELITLLRLVLPDIFCAVDTTDDKFKYLRDDDMGAEEEVSASREAAETAALVDGLQKEVTDMVKAARKAAATKGSKAGKVGKGGVTPPKDAAPSSTTVAPPLSVADILSVFILRRAKDMLSLGLPPKTRHTVWVDMTTSQAGAASTVGRTLMTLLGAGTAMSRALRAAVLAGSDFELAARLLDDAVPETLGAGRSSSSSSLHLDSPINWSAHTPLWAGDLCGVLHTTGTSSSSSDVAGASGASGKLAMLLRKAAIHPLLLRLRYTNDIVLDMARRLYEEEGEGGEERAGGKRLRASGAGAAPRQYLVHHTLYDAVHGTTSSSASSLPDHSSDAEFLRLVERAHSNSGLLKPAMLLWAGGKKKLSDLAMTMLTLSDYVLDQEYAHSVECLQAYKLPQLAYEDSAKVMWFKAELKRIKAARSRVLVFSQFTEFLDVMGTILNSWGEGYSRLDGSTRVQERQPLIDEWSADPRKSVMLLSTRAGGLGINIVAADTVVFMDCDWNPTNDAQAEDRCYRIGQTRPVTVHRLLTRGTLELHMANVAEGKTHLAATLMGLSEKPMSSHQK